MNPWELQLWRWTTGLRVWLLDSLTDADLAVTVPGNPPLGALLVDLGRTERAYIDSFVSRVLTFSAPVDGEPSDAAGSVAALQAWFAAMDAELEAVVTAFPEDEFRTGTVDRGGGFSMPLSTQFSTFRESILIVMAKVDVYLRAMGRHRGEQWEEWLG